MPLLSEADPRDSAEGTIDPLGIYAIADALAVKMIPGVRERQQHPRFLTSIAVSLHVCSVFPEDKIAADGKSEPWQVFEWYLVEGLVRGTEDRKLLRGLPGQDKAATAIKDRVPLSAARYLKTPTVFGFHGIYRALARELDIVRADRLGDTGVDLLAAWEKEQGLQGFRGSGDGPGKSVFRRLVEAVRDGLDQGAVAKTGTWNGWPFFRDHLGIYEAGLKEAEVICRALLNPGSGFRSEVLSHLISADGQKLWQAERAKPNGPSERRFHEALFSVASPELKSLLSAIDIYERFARLLQDAFDDVLFELSKSQTRVKPSELAQLDSVKKASQEVPECFVEVAERLTPFGEAIRFHNSFSSLAERGSTLDWLNALLEHHCQVQRSKPPAGKAPWFDRFDDGSCLIRTGYIRLFGGRHDDSYVHAYRTTSLWSFAVDLGLVK
jgi:hypothetical protein